MPSYIRLEVNKWHEHMDLILLNATGNLWVSEKGGMSVMGMLGSTALDSSAPLDLPRSAPLRLSGDGQSLSVDDDIRQWGRDHVSSVLSDDIMTSQASSQRISNEILQDNTVHLGLDVSRGPSTDNQLFHKSKPFIPNTLGSSTPGSIYVTRNCPTPSTNTVRKFQRDTKDGKSNKIADTSRSQLEQYLLSRQISTSGNIQQFAWAGSHKRRGGNARNKAKPI